MEIVLNNYWIDRSAFWDWWVAQDGPPAAKQNIMDKCEELGVARLRRSALILDGHAGPGAPALEIAGAEGFKHAPSWDVPRKRYELDVDHNGEVRIALKAAGSETHKAPPQGLSRNLALGRTTEASSAQNGSAAAMATDGAHGTAWQPAGAGAQWLRVDLGEPRAVSACKVVGVAPKDGRVAFQLQAGASPEGPWRTVREGQVGGEFFEVCAVVDAPAQRHARLHLPSCPEGFRVREWGLYAGPNDELVTWAPLTGASDLRELITLMPKASSEAERRAVEAAAADFCATAKDRAACVERFVEAAGIEIAARLAKTDPAAPRRTLAKLIESTTNPKLREKIQAVAKEVK